MLLDVIQLGNSRGLKIPEVILEEYDIKETVELCLKDGYIELRPTKSIREHWRKELKELANDANEEGRIADVFEGEDLVS